MNATKVLNFKFHTDPGHGWLACKIELLRKLNILSAISCYSYFKGGTAYLEEDCDAPRLLEALKANGIEYKIESSNTNNRSPIRSYPRFSELVK